MHSCKADHTFGLLKQTDTAANGTFYSLKYIHAGVCNRNDKQKVKTPTHTRVRFSVWCEEMKPDLEMIHNLSLLLRALLWGSSLPPAQVAIAQILERGKLLFRNKLELINEEDKVLEATVQVSLGSCVCKSMGRNRNGIA